MASSSNSQHQHDEEFHDVPPPPSYNEDNNRSRSQSIVTSYKASFFDGKYYDSWKLKMSHYLLSIGGEVLMSCLIDEPIPDLKDIRNLSKDEYKKVQANS